MSSVWTGPYGSKAGRLHNSDSKDEMKSLTEQVSRRGNILRIFAAGFPTDEIKIDVGVVREQRTSKNFHSETATSSPMSVMSGKEVLEGMCDTWQSSMLATLRQITRQNSSIVLPLSSSALLFHDGFMAFESVHKIKWPAI